MQQEQGRPWESPDPWPVEQAGTLLTKPAQPLLDQRPGVTCHCYLHSTDAGSLRIKPHLLPEGSEGGLTSLGLDWGTATRRAALGVDDSSMLSWTQEDNRQAPTGGGGVSPLLRSLFPHHAGRLPCLALDTTQPGTDRPHCHRTVTISVTRGPSQQGHRLATNRSHILPLTVQLPFPNHQDKY